MTMVGIFVVVGLFAAALGLIVSWYFNGVSNEDTAQTRLGTQLSDADRRILERDFPKQLLVQTQQAIELIDIERSRGESPALKRTAEEFRQTRAKELGEIAALLDGWNEPYQNLKDFPQHDGHDMYPSYDGMATLAQMNEMKTMPARGVDERFLDLMNRSVDGSLRIIADQQDVLVSPEVAALAQRMKDARMKERTELTGHAGKHDASGSHH